MLWRRVGSLAPCLSGQRTCGRPLAQAIAARHLSGISSSARLGSLRSLLAQKRILRAIEVHSGFSALVVDEARARRPDGTEVGFDLLWSSSLTSSAIKGKPDIEIVSPAERCHIVEDVLEVSNKPILFDADTGGEKEVFSFTVRRLERLGVSGVVIEDKRGLKQNSLFGTDRTQLLEDVDTFCRKLSAGKQAQIGTEFMIFARIEALIAGLGQEEALKRAHAYVQGGGADGIMIHSKSEQPDEILRFLQRYRAEAPDVPVIVVPTTYNGITEAELEAAGATVCIYANQLIRSAYLAMLSTANQILAAGRSKEVDGQILPAGQLIRLIDDHSQS